MLRTTTALMIVLAAGHHVAWADFVLLGERTAAKPTTSTLASHSDAGPGGGPARPIDLAPSQSGVPVASGFGRHVPLSFAVRQIVPPNLHVIYANGIDSGVMVDWTGGQAWNAVLTRAVAPLGLRVQVSPAAVTISR